MAWIQRLWTTIRRRALEDELDEEMRFHIESRTEDNIAAGRNPTEARKVALRQFGNQSLAREQTREMDILRWLETVGKDIQYAGRIMRRSPGFTFFAVTATALGIGATTLMFGLVSSLIFDPLPFRNPNELFRLWQTNPQEARIQFSPRDFQTWAQDTQVFESLAAFSGNGFMITGEGEPEMVIGEVVSSSFFNVLGAEPSMGRTFLPSEGSPGNDHQVVLSSQLWRDKFDSRKGVIGDVVVMNDEAYTIIGVMPPAFAFPDFEGRYKLWVPGDWTSPKFGGREDSHFISVVGRLKPGMGVPNLLAEIAIMEERIGEVVRDPYRRYFPVGLRDAMSGDLRPQLLVLLAAVGMLLTIACANVANLTLARAISRKKEIAIRGALGASRGRLLRQLFIESIFLALCGGAIGFVLAKWGLQLVILVGSPSVPALAHSHISLSTAGFAFLISGLSGVVFGIVPALAASRTDFQTALKEGGRSSEGARAGRTRNVLAGAEIAIASVLILGSGLMFRSYIALADVNPGFRAEGALAASVVLKPNRYPDGRRLIEFYKATMSRIREIPGVTAAGMASHMPFTGSGWGNTFEIEGRPQPPGQAHIAQIRPISPGYFGAMGISFDRGRDFTDRDDDGSPGVAVVNEVIAGRFWGPEDPIGKRIRFDNEWLTIIGICGDIKHEDLAGGSGPEIYIPYLQLPGELLNFLGRDTNYIVRSAADPETLAAPLRSVITDNVFKIRTVQKLVDQSIAAPRFRTWMVALFAMLALVLAGVGIYGVIAYNVTQRSRDFGIRIALGASRSNILGLILRQSLIWSIGGILSGIGAAAALSRFLRNLLFGISVYDPVTYAVMPLFLFGVALLASYVPARRATRVDPLISLRYE
jgi:predicted permease